ncbi:MAG: polysaccharide deacetylase family protein [Tsuneonella sp.]
MIPLDTLADALGSGPAPRFATAITFDDGYRDNLTTAAPILAEFGLPATMFVSTGHIDSGRPFWWDELAAVVPDPQEQRREWQRLAALPRNARTAELDALRRRNPAAPRSEALTAGADMLRECAGSPLTVGCHAHSHEPLTALPLAERGDEIAGSRAELSAILGTPPAGFAYPHGAWDAQTARLVAEAGFAWAVGVENRAVPRGANRYALPRLTVGDWSAARLRQEIRAAGA